MSTLVNYAGDDDFHAASALYSNHLDTGLFLSLGSHVDVFCPPRKRSRSVAPLLFSQGKVQPEKPCSIDVLPDECLIEIFRRLPGEQERSVCACVSKHWLMLLSSIRRSEICNSKDIDNTLKNDEQGAGKLLESSNLNVTTPVSTDDEEQDFENDGYLSRFLEGKKATDVRLAAISIGSYSRGGLGKLQIRGSYGPCGAIDLGLSAIARGCPSLKVLSLWNVSSVSDQGLCEIANGCNMLEKLDLSHCPFISNKGLIAIAQNCPNLTELAIESCPKIGDESLEAIGRCCPKLRSISITNCALVGDKGISSLLSSASTVLTKIKLQALNVSDYCLAAVGHYGLVVTDLVLTGLQLVDERGFWAMGRAIGLQMLKSLTITSCPGLTDVSLEAIGHGCPNLQQLNLKRSFISDNGLRAFAKVAISLENLQLEECNNISLLGIFSVMSNCGEKLKALALVKCFGLKDEAFGLTMLSPCKSLRFLTVRDCPGFSSMAIDIAGKLCPHLQVIDFSGLHGATDAGIISLLKSCVSGLVKVSLVGCINISDAVVYAVVGLHGATLRRLNISGCMMVTDKSMFIIANNCRALVELDVSKCNISDAGVEALADSTHLSLNILSLSGCFRLSGKCVPYLRRLGIFLEGLNLQNCNSINSRAIVSTAAHLWGCEVLL